MITSRKQYITAKGAPIGDNIKGIELLFICAGLIAFVIGFC